jgi:hypothetical protein
MSSDISVGLFIVYILAAVHYFTLTGSAVWLAMRLCFNNSFVGRSIEAIHLGFPDQTGNEVSYGCFLSTSAEKSLRTDLNFDSSCHAIVNPSEFIACFFDTPTSHSLVSRYTNLYALKYLRKLVIARYAKYKTLQPALEKFSKLPIQDDFISRNSMRKSVDILQLSRKCLASFWSIVFENPAEFLVSFLEENDSSQRFMLRSYKNIQGKKSMEDLFCFLHTIIVGFRLNESKMTDDSSFVMHLIWIKLNSPNGCALLGLNGSQLRKAQQLFLHQNSFEFLREIFSLSDEESLVTFLERSGNS